MNKLAVLAFTLLVSLSTMLWFLANGSLNEYLKSQIEIQGHYYTGQKTDVVSADFSSSTGIGEFKQFSLVNLEHHQAQHALLIDIANIELVKQPTQPLLTTIKKITINKLTLNIEKKLGKKSNIEQLIEIITIKLAQDYPELYPNISAKIYAQNNPELNAEEFAQNNPQAGPIIEHTKAKKKRGKPQVKINVSEVAINTVELTLMNNGLAKTTVLQNVNIMVIGGENGIVTNQLGGEILLALLDLTTQS